MNNSVLVQHKSLKEEIFDFLHGQTITGKFLPGDWLRQDEIANQLGVSMTPVREALDLLVASGLAERIPYRGVRVMELTNQEITEAYGLRMVLEGLAAREAASVITVPQIQHLEEIIEQMRMHVNLSDMSHARQLSREFHQTIVDASGNQLLSMIYQIVSNRFPDWMLYEALFRHPELLENSLAREHTEHSTLVKALKDGNPELACQSASDHIISLGRDIEELLGIPVHLIKAKESPV